MSDGDTNTYTDPPKLTETATAGAKRKARNRRKAAAKKRPQARKNSKPLSHATLVDLARSGLDAIDAAKMGIEDMTAAECDAEYGIPRAAYRLPYADFDSVCYGFARARFTDFCAPAPFNGREVVVEQIRYTQKSGTGVHVYLPMLIEWRPVIDDTTIPVYSAEGEKKAAAACKAGVITVGLGGVDAFASSRRDIDLLPELMILAKDRRMQGRGRHHANQTRR